MKRILIIDDDDFILFGLSRAIAMQEAGTEVLTARHGKQAMDILAASRVDCIVTDVKMPVMNGYEVVEYAFMNFPRVPVYVMTGDYIPDEQQKFRAAAVFRFVPKPFSFRQVAADILAKLTIAGRAAHA